MFPLIISTLVLGTAIFGVVFPLWALGWSAIVVVVATGVVPVGVICTVGAITAFGSRMGGLGLVAPAEGPD